MSSSEWEKSYAAIVCKAISECQTQTSTVKIKINKSINY